MRSLISWLLTLCIAVAMTIGVFQVLNNVFYKDPAYTPPTYNLDENTLTSSIEALISQNSDLDISISITDLQTSKNYHFGDTSSFTAASVGKLIAATKFLHEVEMGRATMDEQIGYSTASAQLEKMIVKSDNDAWRAFNNKLTYDGLQQYAASIGITSYSANDNTIGTNDVALLLSELARGQLLDNENTNLLLSLMQQANYRDYIVAGIPEGATVYHKVGYLSDRLHDVAIIKKGDRAYVLAVFSKSYGSYDFSQGESLMQGLASDISNIIFNSQATTSTP